MRKVVIIVLVLIISYTSYGQLTTDYLLKAKALNEAGKPDLAIELISGAIDEKGDNRLMLLRADAKLLKGDYSGAITDYNEANKIEPTSGEYGLSRVYAIK